MTHKEWIEQQGCYAMYAACYPGYCSGPIVAHHVRTAANSGAGMKPSDEWLVPLCDKHHKEGHQKGWKTFERKYGVDLKAIAKELARENHYV